MITRILLLTLATFIWGMGFVGTRWTLNAYSPYWSNALRFLFAGILSLPILIFYKTHRRPKNDLYKAVICSLALGLGLGLQTMGIKHTSLAKSGFLTTFYAIFTPLLAWGFLNKHFRKSYWFLVGLSLIGVFFLCDLEFERFNNGDFYILVSAILFSIHILLLDRFANDFNSLELNGLQCLFIGLGSCFIGATIDSFPSFAPLISLDQAGGRQVVLGFLILSVFSSFIAFSIQIYVQKDMAPHIVSLIFLMESVFATAFGFLFFDETISRLGLFGCFLVLLSVSLIPKLTNPKKQREISDV